MFYTIYQITNLINRKIYIGKHQTKDPNDDYYGSGRAVIAAMKKYGKECFYKEILFIFDTALEMNNKEKELITEAFVAREDTYNLGVGGEGGPHFKGKKHSKETMDKLQSPEVKKKQADTMKSKYASGEIVIWNKGKETSVATRQKLSESKKGKQFKHTEETKEKIRQGVLASPKRNHTDETKEKMRQAKIGKVRTPHTEEQKLALSIAMTESHKRRKEAKLNIIEE